MSIDVRLFTPEDSEDVLNMLKAIAAQHHSGRPDIFLDTGAKYTRADLETLASDPNERILIADTDERRCAGYLFCKISDRNLPPPVRPCRTLWVDDLFVCPDCRCGGVGRALMEHAAAFARRMDCERLELNVWAFNEQAAAFYAQCGLKVQRQILELVL